MATEQAIDSQLSQIEVAVLRFVAGFRYLVARQVALLCSDSEGYTRKLLLRLVEGQYLERHWLVKEARLGGDLAYYHLATKGFTYLKRQNLLPQSARRPSDLNPKDSTLMTHTLECQDLIIAGVVLYRQFPAVQIGRLKTERDLRPGPGQTKLAVYPDGWIELRCRDDEAAIAFEVDRSTTDLERMATKLGKYRFFWDRQYRLHFKTDVLAVGICVSVGGRTRVESLLKVIEEVYAKDRAFAEAVFTVTAVDPASIDPEALYFDPLWVQPFSRKSVSLLPEGWRSEG